MKLKRYGTDPILEPVKENEWESLIVTNPTAWYDEEEKEVKLIYRAAGNDDKHLVYLGMATSKDGYNFERVSDKPIVSPNSFGMDEGCVEDPRIIKIGEYYYITYAFRPYAPGKYWEEGGRAFQPPACPDEFPLALKENMTSTGLLITKDFKEFVRAGRLTDPMVDDRDVIIFPEKVNGKWVTLHRPMQWHGEGYPTEHPAMWIAYSDDLLQHKVPQFLAKAEFDWEVKIGGSTPPLKTPEGWLTLYHGVGPDKHYRIGAMLLDLENPSKITHRTRDWIFQPEMDWETKGFYDGVVFPCGNVIIDETLFVYYGGGDRVAGLATCEMKEIMDYLLSCPVKNGHLATA